MSYKYQARTTFTKLKNSSKSITSKVILNDAWNITKEAFYRGRQLSLEPRFYVYALLDPRRPGSFEYILPGGKVIRFSHEPFYIGKGQKRRADIHVWEAKVTKGHTRKLNVIRKILRAGLDVIVVRSSTTSIDAIAISKEKMLIKTIGRLDLKAGPLTNGTDGGDGQSGAKPSKEAIRRRAESLSRSMTPERRARIAEAVRSRVISEETRAKLRERTYSEETRAKLRAAALKRPPMSQETKNKISKANKGRKHTEEWKRRMSEISKGRPGISRPHTKESRRKISEALKGRPGVSRPHTEQEKQHLSRALKAFWKKKHQVRL